MSLQIVIKGIVLYLLTAKSYKYLILNNIYIDTKYNKLKI